MMFDSLLALKDDDQNDIDLFFNEETSGEEGPAKAETTYSTVREKIEMIYQTISGCTGPIDPTEPLNLTKEQRSEFQQQVISAFSIEVEPTELASFGDTIEHVAQFVWSRLPDCNGGSETDLLWESTEKLRAKIDITLKMLDGYGVSEEGLASGLLKVFIGVTDLFLKIGNTFKTNVFKFFKSLKRSEIRFYWESHMLLCKKVEQEAYTKYMDLRIPVPSGMVATYPDAINYIKEVYEMIDLLRYGEAIYDELLNIRRQMTRSQDIYRQGFKPTAKAAVLKEQQLKKILSEQSKYFSDKNTGERPFKEVFGSMQEFMSCRSALLEMEKYLGDTNAVVHLLDNIYGVIGDITGYLTEDQEVDKLFISDLAQTIRLLATSFDVYGTCVVRQMALEHNVILVYQLLYKNI